MKETIRTKDAPAAIGPYSQALRAGDFLFVSGQLGIDPANGKLVDGGVEAQTKRALQNLAAILAASGSTMDSVVRTTVFMQSMEDFSRMNAVYSEFFGSAPPARAAFQVARLPLDALVEIEAIAYLGR